jgi:hypothetical protein
MIKAADRDGQLKHLGLLQMSVVSRGLGIRSGGAATTVTKCESLNSREQGRDK